MKKLFCIIVTLLLIVSITACGSTSDNNNNDNGNNNTESNNETNTNETTNEDDSQTKQPVSIVTKEAYIGTWSGAKTDKDASMSMTLQLNADGKGLCGKNAPLTWSFDETTKQITIIFDNSDGTPGTEKTTAKITNENTLEWDYSFKMVNSAGEKSQVNGLTFYNHTK